MSDVRDTVPGMTRIERDWAIDRSHPVGLAVAKNIMSSVGLPCAVPSGERNAKRAGTFVVVGAGPSLDKTGQYLAALREAGATIVTVNSACPAVRKYVEPDVVVAREIHTVHEHLAGLPPTTVRALDVGCSPEMFERCAAEGATAWFVAGTVSNFELAHILGVRPLYGGDAALTAAVALCDAWGAEEIVLVGVDLAIADDGATYGEGTAWAGQRAKIVGAVADGPGMHVQLEGPGLDARNAVADGAGVARPPSRGPVITVTAYGGVGRVTTQSAWVSQIEWLMQRAGRDPGLRCVDATGAGAGKPAWYEASVEKVLADLQERATVPVVRPVLAMTDVPAGRVQAAVEWIEKQAVDAQVIAATVVDPLGCAVACPGLWDQDLVAFVAAAGQIRAIERPGTILDKIRGVYGAMGAAGADVLKVLTEEQVEPGFRSSGESEEGIGVVPRGNAMPNLADIGPTDPDRLV